MIFLEVSNELTKLKMFPYFDIAHFVVTCLYLREDLSTGMCRSLKTNGIVPDKLTFHFQDIMRSRGSTPLLVGFPACSLLLRATYSPGFCLVSPSWRHSKAPTTSFLELLSGMLSVVNREMMQC